MLKFIIGNQILLRQPVENQEIKELKKPFEELVKKEYSFLTENYGFEKAKVTSNPEEFMHCVIYLHEEKQIQLDVVNAFHDFDNGFEITLHDLNSPGSHGKILYHKTKEDQDPGMEFVVNGAHATKTEMVVMTK